MSGRPLPGTARARTADRGEQLEVFGRIWRSAVSTSSELAPSQVTEPLHLTRPEPAMPDHPASREPELLTITEAAELLRAPVATLPVWRLLGLRQAGPPTSWTLGLGDPDETARKAEQAHEFESLKLKLGGRDGLDVERVRSVRAVWDKPIRVDVNEYWTLDEALESIPQLQALGVDYVEQPLPAGDADGPKLKAESPLPIYVDEDCHTLSDVAACAERGHGINIKLAKSGGIREAVRMAHAARALGLGVMLGCMVESGLGIAAGAAVASLCDHVALDGNILIAEDPWPGVQLVDGVQLPSNSPGLGVRATARTA